MSDTAVAEECREETESRSELGNGSVGAKRDTSDGGGKRDSSTSSGSEGSQQLSTQALQGPAQGQGSKGHGQAPEEHSDGDSEKSQVRHVEASPQGRYLRFEDKLGTGQYKVVYRSYDTSMGIEVAWNTVNIKNLPKEEKKRIMNEVRLLQNLEHKNLVQFHGSWVNREKEEVVFVTEIMQSGSLMDFIRKVEMIRWRVVKRWARQILRGVNYLHSQDPPIIHRDLKCDNIFINGAAGDIRIGDLGLSTSNTRSEKTMSVLGTPEFMAPELYEEFYTEKVDIYAFGMCMLEMVTKERPYSECVNAAQIYRKVTSQIPPYALERVQNVRAREFIRVCLSPDPDERPTAMELLDHPFLKDKNEEEDNTLVILDSVAAEGHASESASAAGTSTSGMGMSRQLTGVSHPAQRGAPELPTIEEAASAGLHGTTSQAPTPTSGGSQGHSADLTSAATLVAAAGSSGTSEAGNSMPVESSDGATGDASTGGKSSYNAMNIDSVGNEGWEVGNEGSGTEAGSVDKSGRPAVFEHPPPLWKTEGVEAGPELDAGQFGGLKVPGNPPYETDEDEGEETENDVTHPERFLRAMPEDERAMRVLKLPDGRVPRTGDNDDDPESIDGSDEAETAPVATNGQKAPSSAQAPPLSSSPAHSTAEYGTPASVGPGASSMQTPSSVTVGSEVAAPFFPAPRPLATAGFPSGGPVTQVPRPLASAAAKAPTPTAVQTPRTSAPATPSSAASSTQGSRPPTTVVPPPLVPVLHVPRPPTTIAPAAVIPMMQAPPPTAPAMGAPAMQHTMRSSGTASTLASSPSVQAPRAPTASTAFSSAPSMQAPRPPLSSTNHTIGPTTTAPRPPTTIAPVAVTPTMQAPPTTAPTAGASAIQHTMRPSGTASTLTGGPSIQAPRPPTATSPFSSAPSMQAPRPPLSSALHTVGPTTMAPRPPTTIAPVAVTPTMQAPPTTAPTAGASAIQHTMRPSGTASTLTGGPSIQAPRPPTATSPFSSAPSMQAPRPPLSSALHTVGPTTMAPRPPISDYPDFRSTGGHRSKSASSVEGSCGNVGLMITRGASTPGRVSRPGRAMLQDSNRAVPSSTFNAVRGVMPGDEATAPATATSTATLVSDPGFGTPSVGLGVAMQRARSFSPVERVQQNAQTAVVQPSIPSAPNIPAPSLPAPPPPGTSSGKVDSGSRRVAGQSADVPGSTNGTGPGVPIMFERGERQQTVPQQSDTVDQESLTAGLVGSGLFPTEIKIANLQGPEREIMRMVMHAYIDGRMQEVEFDFNLEEEHPDEVSAEMVHELGLPDEELGKISAMISELAARARKRRTRRPSNTNNANAGQIHGPVGVASASFGSNGDAPVSGVSEGQDNDPLGYGVEEVASDDEVDFEDDDEYRMRRAQHDKKKRQAEKAYEARLAALLAARNSRDNEHIRAQERYKKERDDFDRKVEKLQNEKERRMEECSHDLRRLEDGYRQRHRDARQQQQQQGPSPLSTGEDDEDLRRDRLSTL